MQCIQSEVSILSDFYSNEHILADPSSFATEGVGIIASVMSESICIWHLYTRDMVATSIYAETDADPKIYSRSRCPFICTLYPGVKAQLVQKRFKKYIMHAY